MERCDRHIRVYSLNTQAHGSLDGLAVSDQVRSILVLLPQQILALLLADAAVVTHRQSCCHVIRQSPLWTRLTTCCFLSTASCQRAAALHSQKLHRSPDAVLMLDLDSLNSGGSAAGGGGLGEVSAQHARREQTQWQEKTTELAWQFHRKCVCECVHGWERELKQEMKKEDNIQWHFLTRTRKETCLSVAQQSFHVLIEDVIS